MADEFKDKQHWEIDLLKSTRRWIGFFDILGFKKYVENTELLKAVTEFGNALREAHREALKSSNTSISSKGSKDPVLKSLMFSDSILFYIEPDIEFQSAFHYMVTSSAILLAKFIEKGFLLRGAISFGQLYVNVENSLSLLLGKGLIDTYNQENAQEWAGCMINPEMSDVWKKLNSSWAMKSLIKSKDLIKYDIPFKMKKEQKEQACAINWINYLSKPAQEVQDFLIDKKEKLYKDISGDKGPTAATIKIENTLTFLKRIQSI